jgi:hypothetical protein
MTQSNIISDPTVFAPATTGVAFQKVLPEILALPDDDTLTVGMDVVAGATMVLGLVHRLQTLRPQIAELPGFDKRHFDGLQDYAHALIHAHALHRSAQVPKAHVAQLGNELAVIRDRLYGNAMSLAENGLLEATRLKDCKTNIGYRAIATDVITLTELFKEYWPNIEGKTPITPALMNDAANRAAELLTSVGLRAQASETAGEKAQMRAKAYTLFLNAYEDVRHAVEFVRRKEKDAIEFTPSLFAGRGGRRRAEDADQPEQGSTPPAAAGNGNARRSEPPAPLVIENPEGLPIDSPYTN